MKDAGLAAKDLQRPGIDEALRVLERAEAQALVAAKLDRLVRAPPRPAPAMSPYVIEGIGRERAAGTSLAAIVNRLNSDRIPTAQGGRRWYPATVRCTLNRTR